MVCLVQEMLVLYNPIRLELKNKLHSQFLPLAIYFQR